MRERDEYGTVPAQAGSIPVSLHPGRCSRPSHWMTAARRVVGCALSQFKALMAFI
jgi:hypothetical protein